MSGSELGEIYFIAAMMVLILILSFVAVFFFVKTYRKEMREKNERLAEKGRSVKPVNETDNAAS